MAAPENSQQPPQYKRRPIWRVLKWILLTLLLLLLLLTAAVGLLLGTESGRLWLLNTGVNIGLGEGPLQVEFENESAPGLGEWRFGRILVTRDGETLADISDLHLRWQPGQLLQRRVKVNSLSANEVDIYPDAGAVPEEEPAPAEDGAEPPPIAVEAFAIDRLSIHSEQRAIPDYQLSGSLWLFWDELPIRVNFDAQSLAENAPMMLSIRSKAETDDRLRLTGTLEEEPGGLVGELLQLPQGNGIDAAFDATVERVPQGYAVDLHQLELPFLHRHLAAEGSLQASPEQQRVVIEKLSLHTDEQTHAISGSASADQLDLQVVLDAFPLDLLSPWVEQVDGGQLSADLAIVGPTTEPRVSGSLDLATIYQDLTVEVETTGEFSPAGLTFEQLNAAVGDATLEARGHLDLEGDDTDLQFTAANIPTRYAELANVELPPDFSGRLITAQGRIRGDYRDPEARIDASAEATYRERNFSLAVAGAGNQRQFSLDSASVQTGNAALRAEGLLDLEGAQSDVTVEAEQLPLELLDLAELDLPEGLEDLTATLNGRVNLQGELTSPMADGNVRAAGSFRGRNFGLRIDGRGNQQQVSLRQAELNLGEAAFSANGTVDLEGRQTDLNVDLNELPLELLELADIALPPELAARISGSLQVAGALTAPNAAGELRATGRYQDQPFTVSVAGSGNPKRAEVEQAELALGEARLQMQGTLDLEGEQNDIEVVLSDAPLTLLQLAQVEPPEGLTGEASGYAKVRGSLQSPTVISDLRLSGTYDELPFNLTAHGSLVERRLDLQEVQLTVDGSTALAANGFLHPDAYDLELTVHNLPSRTLSALGWDLITGDFNGRMRVQGTPEEPDIEGHFSYAGELAGLDLATGERTRFELGWTTQFNTTEDQVLQVVSDFARDGAETGRFNLALPLTDYLVHIREDRPTEDLPVVFDADGGVDLAVLSLVLDPDIHRISGRAAMRLAGSGTLADPNLNGVFELLNTRYENTLTGTLLTDIQLLINSRGTELTIAEATARGGGNGRLEAQGSIDWSDPEAERAVNVQLTARNANLINREDIDGEISGDLALTGSFAELWLRGEVNVRPLSANIDAALQSDIPEIEVTEIHGDPAEAEPEGEAITLGPTVNLDLVVRAEQQAYLRGRGLEAELRGEIQLRGTLENPSYEGEFSIVRGVFEVFGRKFQLDEGEVLFANNALYLRIPGEYEHEDYTIRAELSGTVEDLELSLSSVPDLPEDELLSLLIFGESAQNISAFQALRLAAAVQTLRGGGGGGFDPIGSTRDILGVDRLSVETGGSGVAVGVGKYINDRVYLEVRRTADENQPWEGSVEVELTPRLRLRSTTGGDGRTGAEFLWKRDF